MISVFVVLAALVMTFLVNERNQSFKGKHRRVRTSTPFRFGEEYSYPDDKYPRVTHYYNFDKSKELELV